jgi:hypothetical protein
MVFVVENAEKNNVWMAKCSRLHGKNTDAKTEKLPGHPG